MKQIHTRTRQFSIFVIIQLLLGTYCNSNSESVSMQGNMDNWNKTNYCDCTSCENLIKNKAEPSVIKFNVYGRLGNSMFGYALLLAMKEQFFFRTYLNNKALNQLKKYFKNINEKMIQPVESICPENCNWIDYLYSPKRLTLDPSLLKGHTISYLDDVVLLGKNINGNLRLGSLMEKSEDSIRRSFTMKKAFYDQATKVLIRATNSFNAVINSDNSKFGRWKRTNHRKENKNEGKVTKNLNPNYQKNTTRIRKPSTNNIFVGVHVRRQDAQKKIVKKYGLPDLNPNYYISAMDQILTHVKKRNPSLRVIFIFVSDDTDWVKQRIYKRVHRGFNSFIAETGKPDTVKSIGTDLAILSLCNHTILSYGTYSFWAGFLSNGLRVIPKMILDRKKSPLDKMISSFTMPDEDV